MNEPSAQDIKNAATRAAIAARQAAEYDACLHLAEQAFGSGFVPSGRHYLVDHDEEERCRLSGARPLAAATVYSVRHKDTGERRHFTLDAEGLPHECGSYQEGFGPMLMEPHPTRRIEVRGQVVAPGRYSLCWAGYDLYVPRSAEQLAAARDRREQNALEREADDSLFADQIRAEGPLRKNRGR